MAEPSLRLLITFSALVEVCLQRSSIPPSKAALKNAVNHSSTVYFGLDRASSDTVTRERLSAVRRQFKVNWCTSWNIDNKMITYCTEWARSHAMHLNQAFGEYVLHLNRMWDKDITAEAPQVSHLHIWKWVNECWLMGKLFSSLKNHCVIIWFMSGWRRNAADDHPHHLRGASSMGLLGRRAASVCSVVYHIITAPPWRNMRQWHYVKDLFV